MFPECFSTRFFLIHFVLPRQIFSPMASQLSISVAIVISMLYLKHLAHSPHTKFYKVLSKSILPVFMFLSCTTKPR